MKIKKPLKEDQIQSNFVSIYRMRYPDIPIHADSSGVRLTIGSAMKMKRMGRLTGWPDLFIPKPVKSYHGLFIEMKTPDGDVSPEQKEMHAYLLSVGYYVTVCRSVQEAMDAVHKYFNA
uniref:Putative VRR-NUC domain-containing protein n=1 Tax=viral metagenome TaxID=1070528 RepID=A0A6M3M4T5_9ZZZZ